MSIGTGIVLFVIGAILTFALNFETGWLNLDLVGWIQRFDAPDAAELSLFDAPPDAS